MTREKSWHFAELERHLKTRDKRLSDDSSTVFLLNPDHRKRSDKIISDYLWPAVLRGLSGSSIRIKDYSPRFLQTAITDKWYFQTRRTLIFLLEDPFRPLMPGSRTPLWYCRGTIDCSVFDYLLSFDFIISLPRSFSARKIMKLICNPLFSDLPPELSYEESIDGEGYFVLEFRYGRGAGWVVEDFARASENIEEKVKLNLDIIAAVNELELDLTNTKKFNRLVSKLIAMYAPL